METGGKKTALLSMHVVVIFDVFLCVFSIMMFWYTSTNALDEVKVGVLPIDHAAYDGVSRDDWETSENYTSSRRSTMCFAQDYL